MKNLYIKFNWLALLFILFSCSEDYMDNEGTGTIIGKVVTSETNEPMANVKIETSPISNTVFTDEKGNFTLENVKVGNYSVKAEFKGFITAFKGAVVYTDKTSNTVFEMVVSKGNNKPPLQPILLTPTENELINSTNATFLWTASDPDKDKLTYTLTLYNDTNDDIEIFNSIKDTTFTYKDLKLGYKYFWQVSADDTFNPEVSSKVSSFTVYTTPKDNRIVYTKNINGNLVIFSINQETGEEFQLTSSSVNSFRPIKNVYSNKIAFLRTTGTQTDIYTMNPDGSNQQKITSTIKPTGFDLNEITFSWPSNSDKIYFANFNKLYTISSNGQRIDMIYQTSDNSFISEVDVNIEQNLIALKTNNSNGYNVHLYCIDLQGNFQFDILKNAKGATSGLQISANGKKVLYAYDTSGEENMSYRRISSKIFIYDRSTSTATDYSKDIKLGTNDLEPRFSPNEAYVIFTNTSNDGRSQKDIYIQTISSKTRELKYKNAFMADWN